MDIKDVQSVAVAIITCNRPKNLEKLLVALTQLEMPDFPSLAVRVVVVENGVKHPEIQTLVGGYKDAGLDVSYMHEPTPGISYARNCAMTHAMRGSEFIAFIDDDEWPGPLWLNELLVCAVDLSASVVCGPVLPVFPNDAPSWAEQGGFYARERYETGTEVEYGASNNVLIRCDALREADVWFDPRFALTGGEDTLFFLQLKQKMGLPVIWCDSAIVFEDVFPERLSTSWLMRRAMRQGTNMPQYDAALGKGGMFRLRWGLQGGVHVLLGILRYLSSSLLRRKIAKQHSCRELALGIGMIQGALGGEVNEYSERHQS